MLVLVVVLVLAGCPEKKQASSSAESDEKSKPSKPQPANRTPAAPASQPTGKKALRVDKIAFAGAAGLREDATFRRGEKVIALLRVTHFTYREGRADIRADVTAVGPGERRVVAERDLVLLEGKAPSRRAGQLRGAVTLEIPAAAPPGDYRMTLTVRDRLGERWGRGAKTFHLVGPTPPRSNELAIVGLHSAGDEKLLPGSVVPLELDAAGVRTRTVDGGHRAELDIASRLLDSKGKELARHGQKLLRRTLLFEPDSYPLEYGLALPNDLGPGTYRAVLTLRDRVSDSRASDSLSLEVVPPKFSVANAHIHGAAHLARDTFRFGEQIFVRFAVRDFAMRHGAAALEVDLAIGGPGGVYLSRKSAAKLTGKRSRAFSADRRFPVQVPLTLPALAPAGRYHLVIRARDRLAKRDVTRDLPLTLEGKAPKPLRDLRIDQLQVRSRPELPPLAGDTFIAGRSYHLAVRVGGVKPAEPSKLTFVIKLRGGLRLLTPRGTVVDKHEKLLSLERTLHYRPLRLVMTARWKVPAKLPAGLYDLTIDVLDPRTDRVSHLRRRVEIRRPR